MAFYIFLCLIKKKNWYDFVDILHIGVAKEIVNRVLKGKMNEFKFTFYWGKPPLNLIFLKFDQKQDPKPPPFHVIIDKFMPKA